HGHSTGRRHGVLQGLNGGAPMAGNRMRFKESSSSTGSGPKAPPRCPGAIGSTREGGTGWVLARRVYLGAPLRDGDAPWRRPASSVCRPPGQGSRRIPRGSLRARSPADDGDDIQQDLSGRPPSHHPGAARGSLWTPSSHHPNHPSHSRVVLGRMAVGQNGLRPQSLRALGRQVPETTEAVAGQPLPAGTRLFGPSPLRRRSPLSTPTCNPPPCPEGSASVPGDWPSTCFAYAQSPPVQKAFTPPAFLGWGPLLAVHPRSATCGGLPIWEARESPPRPPWQFAVSLAVALVHGAVGSPGRAPSPGPSAGVHPWEAGRATGLPPQTTKAEPLVLVRRPPQRIYARGARRREQTPRHRSRRPRSKGIRRVAGHPLRPAFLVRRAGDDACP
ncbi:hypothetical protein THAOC_00503, partial [Thalassiosira oceanica]